jgi:hypothetical protein
MLPRRASDRSFVKWIILSDGKAAVHEKIELNMKGQFVKVPCARPRFLPDEPIAPRDDDFCQDLPKVSSSAIPPSLRYKLQRLGEELTPIGLAAYIEKSANLN